MGKFSSVLLASDYDRTLTDVNSRIPQANLDAIRRFEAEGGAFTVATGRSIPMYQACRSLIPANAPLILYNGAAIYDFDTAQLSHVQEIPDGRDMMRDLYNRFPNLWMEVQGIYYHEVFGKNPMRLEYYRHSDAPCRESNPETFPMPFLKAALYGVFRDNTVRQFFSATAQELQELDEAQHYIDRVYGQLVITDRAAPRIIDLEAKTVSKGNAARALAEQLGRPLLVCAGDAPNDVSMLEAADIAIVPADCHEAVGRLGYHKTCSCNQGAIAGAITLLEQLL